MFTLGLFLLAGWVIALSVFHVTTALVHFLLLLAAICFGWRRWDKSRRRAS